MNSSLVNCLMLALAAAIAAAASALLAGWGWLPALALYCAAGSATLVSAALAVSASEANRAPARRRVARVSEQDPSYA